MYELFGNLQITKDCKREKIFLRYFFGDVRFIKKQADVKFIKMNKTSEEKTKQYSNYVEILLLKFELLEVNVLGVDSF